MKPSQFMWKPRDQFALFKRDCCGILDAADFKVLQEYVAWGGQDFELHCLSILFLDDGALQSPYGERCIERNLIWARELGIKYKCGIWSREGLARERERDVPQHHVKSIVRGAPWEPIKSVPSPRVQTVKIPFVVQVRAHVFDGFFCLQ